MNDRFNLYEASAFVKYALAGLALLFGLWLALRSMEKDHEKLLKEQQKNVKLLLEKRKKKKGLRGPLLSRPVDEIFANIFLYLEEITIAFQGRMLQLSYWGRVAVLVVIMALYCFMLVYFKMDETSMEKEREGLYHQIKNAAQEKRLHKNNQNGEKE
jgi:hypothetical protein